MSNVFDFSSDEDASRNEEMPAKKIKLNDQHSKTSTNYAVKQDNSIHKDDHENSSNISYIFSPYYTQVCSQLPIDKGRSAMVHSLIKSYGLFDKMRVIAPTPATYDDLTEFHGREYIRHLKKGAPLPELSQDSGSDSESSPENEEESINPVIHVNCHDQKEVLNEDFGLQDDCPVFPGTYEYVCMTAGGSLQAAKEICNGTSNIVVHWDGGRHHAKRDEAAGFCYVNDIVLCILALQKQFERILYIDIDIHHGDGVEDAFLYDSSVLTLSFHKHGPGYFPGTGDLKSTGKGNTSINVPLQDGMDDQTYIKLFQEVSKAVRSKFDPQVVVMQCGADGLCHDPLGVFNLSQKAYGECLKIVKAWNLPLIVLGGGGYNNADTSRCWAYLTGLLSDTELSNNIPEHSYFRKYGPDFQLSIEEGSRPNRNPPSDIEAILKSVLDRVSKIGQEEEEDESEDDPQSNNEASSSDSQHD